MDEYPKLQSYDRKLIFKSAWDGARMLEGLLGIPASELIGTALKTTWAMHRNMVLADREREFLKLRVEMGLGLIRRAMEARDKAIA
ncbi:hypothetical protein MKK55_18675 [Methylobacterium sp. J-059]|uniref:hypothetical protein n=1 Tax=Methylobacterium sp. J-059 TaxID=2836643 RepID=UPI001FBBB602|nr:hypothetical protein [Methylobacterium sp. J-059]MCJ2040956.1 hypothetical protein [Methylobacterium sp. J-059]